MTFNEVRYIRVYGEYQNPEVIRVSKDGRNWYLVTTDDDEVVEKFPKDLLLTISLYDKWMNSLLWSSLVYHMVKLIIRLCLEGRGLFVIPVGRMCLSLYPNWRY